MSNPYDEACYFEPMIISWHEGAPPVDATYHAMPPRPPWWAFLQRKRWDRIDRRNYLRSRLTEAIKRARGRLEGRLLDALFDPTHPKGE